MSDVTIELRYNEEAEELVVYAVSEDEEEAMITVGSEAVKGIVESYNAKHPEVKVVIEEVRPAEVQAEPIAAGPTALVDPAVDKPAEV